MEEINRSFFSCDRNSLQRGIARSDLAIVILVFIAIVCFALFNSNVYARSSYDSTADSDFNTILNIAQADSLEVLSRPTYFMFNFRGPVTLPAPLTNARLSEGVVLEHAIRFHFLGFMDVFLLKVSHEEGSVSYRYVMVNGKEVKQILERSRSGA